MPICFVITTPYYLYLFQPFAYLMTWIGKSAWQAAQSTLFVTLMRPGEPGVYFEDCVSVFPNPESFNKEAAKKLIEMTRDTLRPYLSTPVIPSPVTSA